MHVSHELPVAATSAFISCQERKHLGAIIFPSEVRSNTIRSVILEKLESSVAPFHEIDHEERSSVVLVIFVSLHGT